MSARLPHSFGPGFVLFVLLAAASLGGCTSLFGVARSEQLRWHTVAPHGPAFTILEMPLDGPGDDVLPAPVADQAP